MPTVSVGRDLLFAALGRKYSEEEFDELCFEFGIELDDVTTEKAIIRKEKHLSEEADENEEVIYKIEVPANRYDLLCLEGIARALRIFLNLEPVPNFKISILGDSKPIRMTVKPETSVIRPYVVCAILRGIQFNSARYNSFIDLQDKLHQNICRKRSLVAIGTHDLDTLSPPFTYQAQSPEDIKFIPLKQTKEFTASELMEFYKTDKHLSKYLHIISDSPVFPVIYDSKGHVLSLPPIINGSHSAISLNTKNVFIECTATDLTKANIVLNTIVTMFSEYCENKFEVQPVEIEMPDGKISLCPKLDTWEMKTSDRYINNLVGITLSAKEMVNLLNRMQLPAKFLPKSENSPDENLISVSVPPTRSDILHPCDIMEDVAIAYGFNNIQKTIPKISTQGKQQPLNHFCDLLRAEIAQAGYTEILTWALIAHNENFPFVNRVDDNKTAVKISNPRSSDFEVVRSSLLPGMLKTLAHNKDSPRPIKLFEISDIVVLDPSRDVGAKNERRLIALYCNINSGFEIIHGLIDRIMEIIGVKFNENQENQVTDDLNDKNKQNTYAISPSNLPEYFTGRQANIIYKGNVVGNYGIVHPQVLLNFDIPDPCTCVEINIDPFL